MEMFRGFMLYRGDDSVRPQHGLIGEWNARAWNQRKQQSPSTFPFSTSQPLTISQPFTTSHFIAQYEILLLIIALKDTTALQDNELPAKDLIIQAITFDEIHVSPSREVEVTVKKFLKEEAEKSKMLVQEDKYGYGNSGGQTLIEDIEAMKRQTLQIPRLLARTEHQERRVATLEGQVGLLRLNSESYLSVRQRFFDVYKRDIRSNHALQGSKAIWDGNVKAHEGDALADASLSSHNQRSDIDLYRELYGLEHKQVLEVHDSITYDGAILTVLNAYATVLAQGKTISDDLEVTFKGFLCQVVKNWLKSPR